MKKNRARRAWVAALLFAAVAMTPTAPLAYAEPAAEPVAVEPIAALPAFPVEGTGTIIIHKLLGATLDQAEYPANGTALDLPPSARPLPGVVFTVTQVNGVDLTTIEGWNLAQAYQQNLPEARAHLGETHTLTRTGASGNTSIGGLPLGLYLVHESAAYAADGSIDSSVRRAGDFLVTLPMRDPSDSAAWLTTVHLYPKNERLALTKAVADGNAGVPGQDAATVGGILTYALTADIPSDGLRGFGGQCLRAGVVDQHDGLDASGFTDQGLCADGATYNGTAAGAAYTVTDDLATALVPGTDRHTSDYLEFSAADWGGAVTAGIVSGPAVPLAPCVEGTSDCDFRIDQSPTRVTVTLTDRGLVALQRAVAAAPDAQFELTVQARVKATITDATWSKDKDCVLVLPNRAVFVPGQWATGLPIPSNEVVTKYANLTLHKVDQRTHANLAGAVFTLYRTEADARAGQSPLAVSAPSDANGMTRFLGVHVTTYQNDAPDNDSYWVVETTAPNGYKGVKDPFEIGADVNGTTTQADDTHGRPVPNRKSSEWWVGLPDTGVLGAENGGLAIGLIGGAVALALAAAVARRRRAQRATGGAE